MDHGRWLLAAFHWNLDGFMQSAQVYHTIAVLNLQHRQKPPVILSTMMRMDHMYMRLVIPVHRA